MAFTERSVPVTVPSAASRSVNQPFPQPRSRMFGWYKPSDWTMFRIASARASDQRVMDFSSCHVSQNRSWSASFGNSAPLMSAALVRLRVTVSPPA